MTEFMDCAGGGRRANLDGTQTAEHAAQASALLRYWQSRRSDADVPRRADIDPRGIEPLLENALIAEKIAPGLARLRVAGTHLTELMGMEVRGMPLSAFIAPDDRARMADALTELFDRPAMVDMALASPGGRGKAALSGRLLLLPLRSDLGDVSRALGVLISDGQIGVGPRRFGIRSQKVTRLDLPAGGHAAAGFAEAPARFEPSSPRLESERPYLRLVK